MTARVKQSNTLEFVWDVAVGGFYAKETVKVRFDNAVSRGVPLPATWKTAIRCARQLRSKAEASASKARDDIVVDAVECELLGRPRHATPPGHHRAPGALVHSLHGVGNRNFCWRRTLREQSVWSMPAEALTPR